MNIAVAALRQTWQAWAELGSTLTDQHWTRTTRLDGWNVQHVYAHYSWAPWFVDEALRSKTASTGSLTHSSAAALLAEMQAPGGVAHALADSIRENAIKDSAEYSPQVLTEQFSTLAPEVLNRLEQLPADYEVDYNGRAVLTLEQTLRLVLLEGVVHYIDMAKALDWPCPGPVAGTPVAYTVELLAELADPIAFIDSATGRGSASAFPVLR